MKHRYNRKDVNEAVGDVGRERTVSGKITGLIVLEKFYETAKIVHDLVHDKIAEGEHDEEVWRVCDSVIDPGIKVEAAKEAASTTLEEVVVEISFMDPLNSSQSIADVAVLGSQTLKDVRQICRCLGEYIRKENKFEEEDEASYFYIEGVFYVDDGAGSRACVDSIVEWAQKRENVELSAFMKWPPVGTCEMGLTTLRSLKLRLNYPYFYSHGGICNHTIYIRKIYFHSSNLSTDAMHLSDFPYITNASKSFDLKCHACHNTLSSYLTVNDTFSDSNVSFWCSVCFDMFHLTPDKFPSHDYALFHVSPKVSLFLNSRSRFLNDTTYSRV